MLFIRTILNRKSPSVPSLIQRLLTLPSNKGISVTSQSSLTGISSIGAVVFPSKDSLSLRLERLQHGDSVVSAFQSWMGNGSPIHRGDIFHAINRLRKLKMNKRALEVMEWVIRERPYKPKELEYSYLLEFSVKIHGISCGETLFTHIPNEFQNELLYNNLVIACLDKGVVRLSLAYMKRMRELSFPISPYVYNRLIILHCSPKRRKYIPKILTQMRADRVARHTSTCNILLKIEADDHNIDGLMKVFSDMKRFNVDPNEITYGILATAHAAARLYAASEAFVEAIENSKTEKNWSTLDILIIMYGYLGKEKELERTWEIVQGLPYVRSKSFILAIEAFGRMGRIDKSEQLWKGMMSTRDLNQTCQFNSIISVYCRSGLLDKASELFSEMEAKCCTPNSITYRHLALGCLKSGLVNEGLKTLELGKDEPVSFQVRRSIPWLETTYSIIEVLADVGELESVKKLFREFEVTNYCRYGFVYNTLLRAHLKAKVNNPNLLENMILSGCRPDAESYSLIRLINQLDF
ncbi:putative Pentatricopeptide repeat-containing protein [Zostera marina]|uniref:Putative Pentatricopeptide repeat-containing protein n=1 Tax=Zostera marina TaxID=29655 RepID=A0A0K9Q606_ZOSMR|nr:putative Pentatricopeptide repeat-containing protein [Zostera marina]